MNFPSAMRALQTGARVRREVWENWLVWKDGRAQFQPSPGNDTKYVASGIEQTAQDWLCEWETTLNEKP